MRHERGKTGMSIPLLTMELRYEQDVVTTRQRTRQIAGLLGFDAQDQTRIATAVSEIARNAYGYGGGGKTECLWDTVTQSLIIQVSDRGPGIPNLTTILRGEYRSSTGMGLGILGARRLADSFEIESTPGAGTTVRLVKHLPRKQPDTSAPDLARIGEALTRHVPGNAFQEVQQQNQELLHALETLQAREAELVELNRELGETNRGVVALYAELDEKAVALQRASELKSRFLANMSHEFRTPVSSILSLTRLLLDRVDGPLTQEQQKQVGFIRQSAQSLLELVSDLLDLAKIEAGKIDVRVNDFTLVDLFSALRGMFKPLLPPRAVSLAFEGLNDWEELDDWRLRTDEGKVSQILRNLISNAIKFTPEGEVRLLAVASGDAIVFSVKDTGIGIPQEHLEYIFEEFHQVKGVWQDKASGTGLGLPLSRRLAELLGGSLSVQSEPGVGSTFQLSLPRVYSGETAGDTGQDIPSEEEASHV